LNTTPTAAPASDTARQTITIRHTNDDGTLVTGTQREDGSREALRAGRLRWSRRLDAWFIPQSRGSAPRRERINQLASSLRDAGFHVNVEIEKYDPEATFDARQSAASDRSDRLADLAEREQKRGVERSQAAHDAFAGIEHHQNATHAEERSTAAASAARRRENPVVMGRKVERLEAEERELKRILRTATGEYAERMRARQSEVQADISFLKERIEQSGAHQYTADDFNVGDQALIRGRWRTVKRVNAKSLSVETPYSWTDKYPYHEVTDRRSAGEVEQDHS
jgi:hypothetical protein